MTLNISYHMRIDMSIYIYNELKIINMLLSYSVMSHRHYIRTAMKKEGIAGLFEKAMDITRLSNRLFREIENRVLRG